MSDRLGMIHAIHELPADDLPRLAYADWLEEHGEVEHAEFIRVELALSHTSRLDEETWRPLFVREVELIRAHKDEWFGTWRHGWLHYEMRRGFIEEVTAREASAVVPHADWLFNHHSMYDLWVGGPISQSKPLLQHPLASILARLSLQGSDYRVDMQPVVRGLPLSERPLRLLVNGHRAGPELIEDLLASEHLGRLSTLDLSDNVVTAYGLGCLLDGLEAFPKLTTLRLRGRISETTPRQFTQSPNVNQEGIVLLAEHPATAQLEEIDLANNRLDSAAVQALVESPFLTKVRHLNIEPRPLRADCDRLRDRFGTRVVLPQANR